MINPKSTEVGSALFSNQDLMPELSLSWPGCYSIAGWVLVPEGGVIHPGVRTAVIADAHLGYEWARGKAGDCVPAHSLVETMSKLDRLLARARIERLVVAGDLVESPRACSRTAADLVGLIRWLSSREIHTVVLEGNHDVSVTRMLGRVSYPPNAITLAQSLVVAGWTVAHGDRPIEGDRTISGHQHPCLRISGRTAPCFLVGSRRIILPAFSRNAAGCDVRTYRVPGKWSPDEPRCLASTGEELLDFGCLISLSVRRRSAGRTRNL
jgi:putative SbcD/Mre11-related phosphoesterase